MELLTVESVSSSLLPTPSAYESQPTEEYVAETIEAGISPSERLYLPGRKWHSQRTLSRVAPALLPTPQAADGDGGRVERTAAANDWKRPSGAKAAKPLGTALALLPTPTTDDANNITRESGEFQSLARTTFALSGANTTPRSGDGSCSEALPLDQPTREAV